MNDRQYFSYHGSPLEVETTPDGQRDGRLLNIHTGEFVDADEDVILRAVHNINSPDIFDLTPEEFLFDTESSRAALRSRTGTAFALYEVVHGIYDRAEEEGRTLTDEERELMMSIYRRTHALWESGEAY